MKVSGVLYSRRKGIEREMLREFQRFSRLIYLIKSCTQFAFQLPFESWNMYSFRIYKGDHLGRVRWSMLESAVSSVAPLS